MTKLETISRKALADAMSTILVSDDPTAVNVVVNTVFEHAENRVNDQPELTGRVYPNYDVMVTQLFKLMPEVPSASLMHAAIGLSGEAAELLGANNRKNLLEECGDLEFYLVALRQNFEENFPGALNNPDTRGSRDMTNLSNVLTNIVTIAGDVLDMVKKSWVYGKPVDTAWMTAYVMLMEINLEFIYDMAGTTRDDVQRLNQIKLIGPGGRFESGFYSDAAAIARADKKPEPGADRNFIGKGL